MKPLLLILALILPAAASAQQRDGFPHDKHAKLFPTCTSCHAEKTAGGALYSLPAPAQCATCHDGDKRRRVAWTPAAREVGLLLFSHATHEAKAAKDVTCQSCHSSSSSSSSSSNADAWMAIDKAKAATCIGCHAHRAPSHYADEATCATCHRTLVKATGLSDARIAALPKTAAHERADFIAAHGAAANRSTASCATCHARQSCARCHLDAGTNRVIVSLAPDARVARLTANVAARNPLPSDHQRAGFASSHKEVAMSGGARCAVCHTQSSCATCHTGSSARSVIGLLAVAGPNSNWKPAPHAADPGRRTMRVHGANVAKSHGPAAATEAMTCSGCHAQRFCKDCHGSEKIGAKRYHVANFVVRHAPESSGREVDCAQCHNTQAFCRDCHRQSGLATTNSKRGSGYHNGQPAWFLQHGQAARQELASCTTCHQQTYCLQCHSAAGLRVSPHGPDFNAARMAARNPTLCARCHLKNPLGGKPF